MKKNKIKIRKINSNIHRRNKSSEIKILKRNKRDPDYISSTKILQKA